MCELSWVKKYKDSTNKTILILYILMKIYTFKISDLTFHACADKKC